MCKQFPPIYTHTWLQAFHTMRNNFQMDEINLIPLRNSGITYRSQNDGQIVKKNQATFSGPLIWYTYNIVLTEG